MDGTGDAQMGAMKDIMHNIWTCSTDDAQMGVMTDVMHNVWTEGMYDVDRWYG